MLRLSAAEYNTYGILQHMFSRQPTTEELRQQREDARDKQIMQLLQEAAGMRQSLGAIEDVIQENMATSGEAYRPMEMS